MTEDEIAHLLDLLFTPASRWGLRPETRMNALKGTKYVDARGQLTKAGHKELERWREAQKTGRA